MTENFSLRLLHSVAQKRFKRKYEGLYIACENKTNIKVLKKEVIPHALDSSFIHCLFVLLFLSGLWCWCSKTLVLSQGKPEKGPTVAFVPGKCCFSDPKLVGSVGKKPEIQLYRNKNSQLYTLNGDYIILFNILL